MASEPTQQEPTHFLESKRFWSLPAAAGASLLATKGAEHGLDLSAANSECLMAIGTALQVWLFGMWKGTRPVALLAPKQPKKES